MSENGNSRTLKQIREEKEMISKENKLTKPFSKKFVKKKEDFVCEKCGYEVIGDGFTNHCPKCLFSKHVDIQPGDRLSKCGGLMKPIKVEGTERQYRVLHKCMACGYEKINKIAGEDNIEALVMIIKENSNNYSKGK